MPQFQFEWTNIRADLGVQSPVPRAFDCLATVTNFSFCLYHRYRCLWYMPQTRCIIVPWLLACWRSEFLPSSFHAWMRYSRIILPLCTWLDAWTSFEPRVCDFPNTSSRACYKRKQLNGRIIARWLMCARSPAGILLRPQEKQRFRLTTLGRPMLRTTTQA